jgi:hypothetical protein
LPVEVVNDSRVLAQEWLQTNGRKPVNRWGLVFVLLVWSVLLLLVVVWWW